MFNNLKKLVAIATVFVSSLSIAQVPNINPGSGITPPTGPITTHPMNDDGYAHVPLQFGFPFFGRLFTNSFMFDNGVVGFFDPTANIGCNPQNNYCGGQQWNSQPFSSNMNKQFSYMIAPYWTDVRPVAGSTYTTQGDSTQMTYRWNNVGEYYNPSRISSFGLQIKPSGFIGIDYTKVDLVSSSLSIGVIGDPSKGEFVQHFWRQAGNQITLNSFQPWNITSTGGNICASDPLSSPSCPGYAEAYFTQQCTISPLYNPSCPGYQQVYFTQQCTINSLYDVNCPGYAAAYLQYQCSVNPLYSTTCEGYEQAYFNQQCSITALHSPLCPGYQEAYFNLQCSLDSLYSTQCPGYQQAYFNQQCSISALYNSACPGYAQAYFSQQCSLNPLYDSACPGYQQAYFSQQCSISGLYSPQCPNYQEAYFNQQCSISGLYSTQCPNYAEAYATKLALEQSNSSPTSPTVNQPTTPATPTVSSSGETKIAVVADPVVNQVITTTATSASPAQAAVATVPLVQSNSTTTSTQITTVAIAQEQKKEEKKEAAASASSNDTSSSSTTTASSSDSSKDKEQPKTARQELQERRVAAARAKAVEDGKNLASNVGKASSMEQQVAVQNVVIQAMGFTPGFEAYSKVMITQVPFYKPFEIYKNERNVNVDNKVVGRRLFGGTDQLHNEMINQQYQLGN